MTTALLVLLALAALCASVALLAAHLTLELLAHVLALGAAVCGFSAFALVAAFTLRRAGRPDAATRP